MMNASSLLTNIKRPPIKNKKIFGVVTIAIIIISLLGLGYYLYIKNNENNIKNHKFITLDNYFKTASKKLDNDYLRIKSIDKSKKLENSNYKEAAQTLIKKNDFDYLFIRIKLQNNCEIFVNAINLPDKDICENILDNCQGGIGGVIDIQFMGEKNKVFSRSYNYKPKDEIKNTENQNTEIQIIGLIKNKNYNSLTRQLDPWIICLLATLLLLFIFGMPFLKMYFIAEDERLNRQDIVFAGFAILIGSPLLFAILLSILDYSNQLYSEIPKELEHLACNISQRFEKENDSIISKLSNFNLEKFDAKHDSDEEEAYIPPTTIESYTLESFKDIQNYFKIISKIDSLGNILYSINYIEEPESNKTPKTLAFRNYFKDIKTKNNLWYYKNIEYVMRPVVSIQDQKEEAVYILPIDSANVQKSSRSYKVGSSQLKSVHQAIMPYGYKFSIIDPEGNIWFHSEKGKATLENLFEFSSNHESIMAAVSGRINDKGNFYYYGNNNSYYVLPIKNTNLSLIAYYDITHLRLKTAEIISLTTIGIFCIFLLTTIITILILIFRKSKNGMYRENTFIFDFLLPKEIYKKRYISLCILLLAIGGAQLTTYHNCSLTVLITIPIVILWSFLLVYRILKLYKPDKKKLKPTSRIQLLFLIIPIVFLNILYLELSDDKNCTLIVIQALLFIILFVKPVSRIFLKITNFIQDKIPLTLQNWYAIFLASWLVTSSLIPSLLLYNKSLEIIEFIWIKSNHFHKIDQYVEKETNLKVDLPPIDKFINNIDIYWTYLNEGEYNLYGSHKIIDDYNTAEGPIINNVQSEYIWKLRPIFSEKIRSKQIYAFNNASDASWFSLETNDKHIFKSKHHNKTLTSWETKRGDNKNKSQNDSFVQSIFKLLKITGTFIFLTSILFLIQFYIDRFFGFKFKFLNANDFDTNDKGDYTTKFADLLGTSASKSGLLIIGPPMTGKSNFAKRILEKKDWVSFSFLNVNQIDKSQNNIQHYFNKLLNESTNSTLVTTTKNNWQDNFSYFILDHLEFDMNSFFTNKIKLELISYLIAKKKHIIIISEIYPSQILSFYQEKINVNTSVKEAGNEFSVTEVLNEFNSWRNIMGAFTQIIIGLTENKEAVEIYLDNVKDLHKKNNIIKELGYSNFLPKLAPIIYAKGKFSNKNTKLDIQRMMIHIQNLSYGYYSDIWNSMPSKERYLIYDLAQDDFINIKNHDSLFTLIKKGLIRWEDKPVIFNQSFKNFVVSSVSKEEALHLEMKNKKEGSWSTVKIVIYLIILTIIVFIALGEPNLINNFQTLVTALGGFGVLIPVLSTMLAKSGSKTT